MGLGVAVVLALVGLLLRIDAFVVLGLVLGVVAVLAQLSRIRRRRPRQPLPRSGRVPRNSPR